MSNRMKNKKVLAVISGTVVVLGAFGAWAFWTAGGSGTGSGNTGTVTAISAVQTSTISGLAPGGAPQELSGTFENDNDGPVYVTSVTASIASVTKAIGAPAGTCDATDYTLADAVMTVNAEASSDDTTTWEGATIQFNNKATNQDACKLATVSLSYAIT